MPNVDIFTSLLDSVKNKNGIYSENVTFIQGQMKKYDIRPNVQFYNKLLKIADGAEQIKEIQKLCQLVLKNMSNSNIQNCKRTLELMIKFLYKYEEFANAQQIYDFYYLEFGLVDHWMQIKPQDSVQDAEE